MNAAIEAVNHAARLWWTHALHITWQGTLLAAIILAILRLGRRWPVSVRCGLVLIALAKFAVPATWTAPTGVFSRLGPALPAAAGAAGAPGAAAAQPTLCWQAFLMGLHALGLLAVAGWIALQCARASRIARGANLRIPVRLRRRFARMARQMHLRRPIRLLASRRPVTPMAFGLLRPAVLIPASLLGDNHVETILAHELAHHRRGDLWLSWFGAVMAAAWWFNPAVWLLGRAMRQICEDGCDDMLLGRHIAAGERYCQALIQAARTLRRQISLGGAAGFAERPHSLGGRIRRIMDPGICRRPRRPVATAAAMMALAAFLLPGLPSSAPGSEKDLAAAALVATPPAPAEPVADAPAPTREAPPAIQVADTSAGPFAWPEHPAEILPASEAPLPGWRTAPIAETDPATALTMARAVRTPPSRVAPPAVAAAGRRLGLPPVDGGTMAVDLRVPPLSGALPAGSSGGVRPASPAPAGGSKPLEWGVNDYLDPSVFRTGGAGGNPTGGMLGGPAPDHGPPAWLQQQPHWDEFYQYYKEHGADQDQDPGEDGSSSASTSDGNGSSAGNDSTSGSVASVLVQAFSSGCVLSCDSSCSGVIELHAFHRGHGGQPFIASPDSLTSDEDIRWEQLYNDWYADRYGVPEPGALALLLIGAAVLRRRRKRFR